MQFAEMGEGPFFHKHAPKWLYHLLLQYGKDFGEGFFFHLIFSSASIYV